MVTGYSQEALEAMSRLVELKLKDFGVDVEVVSVQPGPVVTRFELKPAVGVKVSQISNLAKDLARSLSAISVRVVDIIPGKSVVGLEIPNEVRELVTLGEIIKSKTFDDLASPLALALGKDIGGHSMVADLSRMPHLLIAGTTGSGKSVAINAMVLSLLYKSTAEQVRLIMIDPKMLEDGSESTTGTDACYSPRVMFAIDKSGSMVVNTWMDNGQQVTRWASVHRIAGELLPASISSSEKRGHTSRSC